MRSIAVAGAALAALLGLVATEPAAASDTGHNFQGTDIYVHHYVYGPPGRIRHVYHFQRQGPYHVGFVHGAPYPYAWASDRGGYYWQWRGGYGRW